MKNKIFRKFMGAVLSLALIITGLKFGQISASAEDIPRPPFGPVEVDHSKVRSTSTDGNVQVNKSVKFADETKKDEVVISFDINAYGAIEAEKNKSKGDVVFVIDASGTLEKNGSFEIEKDGAKQLANSLINDGYKVGVISFEANAKTECAPSSKYSVVADAIDGISCTSGSPHFTNMQAGLHAADVMLGAERKGGMIVVLSDGKANQSFRPYGVGKKTMIYNREDAGKRTIEMTLAAGFKYINTWVSNAYDGQLGGSYTKPTYLDENEISYVFSETGYKTKEVDGVYYQLNSEYQNNYNKNNPVDATVKCHKYVKNEKDQFETDGVDIVLTKWTYNNELPNKGYNENVMDTGFMTISEAQLIKDKGTTIYTVTYPNYNLTNPLTSKKYNDSVSYEKYVMTNVATTKNNAHYNTFAEIKTGFVWDDVVEAVLNAASEGEDTQSQSTFSLTLSDELPAYLTAIAGEGFKIEDGVVKATISNFDETGKATFTFTAELDKAKMADTYRKLLKDYPTPRVIEVQMNKNAVVYYGNEEIRLGKPSLPFDVWTASVRYTTQVLENNVLTKKTDFVESGLLFDFETFKVTNLNMYDILVNGVFNSAKFEAPTVEKCNYIQTADGISAVRVDSEIGYVATIEDADQVSNSVGFDVAYMLQQYTVYFFDDNGEELVAPAIVNPEEDDKEEKPAKEIKDDDQNAEDGKDDKQAGENGSDDEADPHSAENVKSPNASCEEYDKAPTTGLGSDDSTVEEGDAGHHSGSQWVPDDDDLEDIQKSEGGQKPEDGQWVPNDENHEDGQKSEDGQWVPKDENLEDWQKQATVVSSRTFISMSGNEADPDVPAALPKEIKVYPVKVYYGQTIENAKIAAAEEIAQLLGKSRENDTIKNVQFVGWDMDFASLGKKKINADSTKVSADNVLNAPITHDLYLNARYTFDKEEGGEPIVDPVVDKVNVEYMQYANGKPYETETTTLTIVPVEKGGSHELLASGPAIAGYDFLGWSEDSTKDATVITEKTLTNIQEDVKLYPVYKEVKQENPQEDPKEDPKDDPKEEPSGDKPSGDNPGGSNPPSYNPPSYVNPTPDTKKEPELDMGGDDTPLGDAVTKTLPPQIITYEGPDEDEIPELSLDPDLQALGDAVLPKTGTHSELLFYAVGSFLTILAGLFLALKKKH